MGSGYWGAGGAAANEGLRGVKDLAKGVKRFALAEGTNGCAVGAKGFGGDADCPATGAAAGVGSPETAARAAAAAARLSFLLGGLAPGTIGIRGLASMKAERVCCGISMVEDMFVVVVKTDN